MRLLPEVRCTTSRSCWKASLNSGGHRHRFVLNAVTNRQPAHTHAITRQCTLPAMDAAQRNAALSRFASDAHEEWCLKLARVPGNLRRARSSPSL